MEIDYIENGHAVWERGVTGAQSNKNTLYSFAVHHVIFNNAPS